MGKRELSKGFVEVYLSLFSRDYIGPFEELAYEGSFRYCSFLFWSCVKIIDAAPLRTMCTFLCAGSLLNVCERPLGSCDCVCVCVCCASSHTPKNLSFFPFFHLYSRICVFCLCFVCLFVTPSSENIHTTLVRVAWSCGLPYARGRHINCRPASLVYVCVCKNKCLVVLREPQPAGFSGGVV